MEVDEGEGSGGVMTRLPQTLRARQPLTSRAPGHGRPEGLAASPLGRAAPGALPHFSEPSKLNGDISADAQKEVIGDEKKLDVTMEDEKRLDVMFSGLYAHTVGDVRRVWKATSS